MSQPKLSDFADFLPQAERHQPRPITNLPVNAISEENDPTLEIRTLIEQLQQAARDARNQARVTEEEKDALRHQLAQAAAQIELLQASERELRSHFTEVTSILKERDAAQAELVREKKLAAQQQEKLAATAREHDAAQRQREEFVRQRDEARRQVEALQRSSAEAGAQSAEAERKLLAIRQARDGAHALNLDLSRRLEEFDGRLADAEYEEEQAHKAQQQAQTEASDFRRQLETALQERTAAAQQVEKLTQSLDEKRRQLLDLAAEKSSEQQADSEHLAALAEARLQVDSLTQERDAAQRRTQEQAHELEELRATFSAARVTDAQAASVELTIAREKLIALEIQSREARQEAATLQQRVAALTEELNALQLISQAATDLQARVETLTQERTELEAALQAAYEQTEMLTAEREDVQRVTVERVQELEGQLTAVRFQLSAVDEIQAGLHRRDEELRETTARLEKQRLETIDLVGQLQAAQYEVRELSANLAEARLQVKFANAASRAARHGPEKTAEIASLASAALDEVAAPAAAVPSRAEELFQERDARSALSAMRDCLQAFSRNPADFSLLNELHCHAQGFAERARTSGYIAVHRLCQSFSELTRGLYEIPEQVNPSTLRTVQQTIEFLALLMKERHLEQVRDPSKALIYAVDDDLGNCESIELALGAAMLRTSCAQTPAVALEKLATSHYDLILLDVNLPEMDGFELCRRIRELELHATTPIVFLTGLATLENRLQSSLCGGNEFIAKPFNLSELIVKTLTLILKAQLHLA